MSIIILEIIALVGAYFVISDLLLLIKFVPKNTAMVGLFYSFISVAVISFALLVELGQRISDLFKNRRRE